MSENRPPVLAEANALLARAERGGPGAAMAARRAAALLEKGDPERAREALALAARMAPRDPAPRLGLARMAAEAGELEAAEAEARAVLEGESDGSGKARAAYMLGEIARARGESAEARKRFSAALKFEDAVLKGDRGNVAAARGYARAKGRLAELDAGEGAFDRATSGAEASLALLRASASHVGETPELAADIADAELRLGALELDANQPVSARRRFGEAIGRYEALAVTEKDEPHWRAVLSDAWALAAEADYVRGAADAARDAMDKALQARIRLAANDAREAWALAGTWRVRAALRAALGDNAAAADSITQARALAEQLHAKDRSADGPAQFLVHTLLDQADTALRAKELHVAREAADEARQHSETFASAKGTSAAWLADASACWDRLGEIARATGASSQDAFARASEMRRMACEIAPGDARHARGLAAALVKEGEAALDARSYASARTAFSESAALRLKLLETAQDKRAAGMALAVALERLGLAAQAMGDLAAARDAWEEELALAFRIFTDDDLAGMRFCAIVESHLAGAGGPEAEAHRQSALERFDVLARAGVLTEREAALRKKLWGAA